MIDNFFSDAYADEACTHSWSDAGLWEALQCCTLSMIEVFTLVM